MECLSWVCPKCACEGDLRPTLRHDSCPQCGCEVQATGYVMRDIAGCIVISPDWVEASGHSDEGFAYVVRGETGKYSDHREWAVRAYTSWGRAKKHAMAAELKAHELKPECLRLLKRSEFAAATAIMQQNEFDPRMRMEYTGTTYHVEVVPLEE